MSRRRESSLTSSFLRSCLIVMALMHERIIGPIVVRIKCVRRDADRQWIFAFFGSRASCQLSPRPKASVQARNKSFAAAQNVQCMQTRAHTKQQAPKLSDRRERRPPARLRLRLVCARSQTKKQLMTPARRRTLDADARVHSRRVRACPLSERPVTLVGAQAALPARVPASGRAWARAQPPSAKRIC